MKNVFKRLGIKGVSGLCGTNAQVSDSCWCLSIWHACLIFRIYPLDPTLLVPSASPPVIKSPVMTLRTFLGTKYYLITPGITALKAWNQGRDPAVSVESLGILWASPLLPFFWIFYGDKDPRCIKMSDSDRGRGMRAGHDKIWVTQMYGWTEGSGITTNRIKIGMNGHKVTRTLIWLQIGSQSHSNSLCTHPLNSQLISRESIRCDTGRWKVYERVDKDWDSRQWRINAEPIDKVEKWRDEIKFSQRSDFFIAWHLGRDIDREPGL